MIDNEHDEEYSPTGWEVSQVKCTECGHESTSVHPHGIDVIQCSECLEMFDYRLVWVEVGKLAMLPYRIKAVIRWLRYSLRIGISFHSYEPHEAGTCLGWYEARGRCIAFLEHDGTRQFIW